MAGGTIAEGAGAAAIVNAPTGKMTRKGLKKGGRYMFTLYDIPRAATAKLLLFPVLSI